MLGKFPLDCLENSREKLETLIQQNKTELSQLLNQSEKTYASFVRPFMDAEERINQFFTPIAHLQNVKNSEKSQEAFTGCIGTLTAYGTELSHNKAVYDAFIHIKDKEYLRLDEASRKVLDDTIQSFQLEGVNLPEDQKARIKEINIRLSELSDQFSQNVLDATNAYKLHLEDEALLGEMPASDKEAAKDGEGWTFTLQMPSYIAFMTYVTDRPKREEVYRAYSTRAPENSGLITEILSLRSEKASILGFKNYAELNLRTMSAPSVEAVLAFLEKLANAGRKPALKDLEDLQKLAAEDGITDFASYDTAFYSEILKKKEYDYDEEALRPYFEKDSVIRCMFNIITKLLEIEFTQKEVKLWDEKATFYEITSGGRLLGGLYLDLEARPDKRGGAWMNNWHTYHKDATGQIHLPEAFVVANFPASKDGNPSLLRHDDVTTLFHEMGHALHHLLSKVDEANLSGVNGIDWDTVEFPSQFLENFAYAPEILDMLGKHYKTGEQIPAALKEKLVAARNFQAGMALVRQVEFGMFDMLIHLKKMDAAQVQKTLDDVRRQVAVILPPAYNKFQNSFSHIFSGGYAAGYYSYKWAEMLSSDAFCAFLDTSVFNKDLALKYKNTVLALGASRKMDDIYRQFLGRDPDPEAILRLAGLG